MTARDGELRRSPKSVLLPDNHSRTTLQVRPEPFGFLWVQLEDGQTIVSSEPVRHQPRRSRVEARVSRRV